MFPLACASVGIPRESNESKTLLAEKVELNAS